MAARARLADGENHAERQADHETPLIIAWLGVYVLQAMVRGVRDHNISIIVVLRLYDRPIEIPALIGILGIGLTTTGFFVVTTAEDIREDTKIAVVPATAVFCGR